MNPPNWTFGIWGVIYTMLTVFIVSSFILKRNFQPIINNIGSLFSISCLFNILWLLVFSIGTKEAILGSVFIITGLLITLIIIQVKGKLFNNANIKSSKEKIAKIICIDIPFSLYLGWVMFATIANVGTTFSAWNIQLNDFTIYVVLISVATFMFILNIAFYNNYVTQLVFLYVICGFLIKFSEKNLNNELLFKFTLELDYFTDRIGV